MIRGKGEVIRLAVISLLAQGHVLIEDVPGVGKTTLAQALARSVGLAFQRVQFTSDLLPSDIIGVSIFNQREQSFEFVPGPLFANVVLADEINRATPKTQSALLEAMSERRVSVDRKRYALPQPFVVLATQNPLEYHGTFPLPESQLDRFMISLRLGYPPPDEERALLLSGGVEEVLASLEPAVSKEELLELQHRVRGVHVTEKLAELHPGARPRHPGVPRVPGRRLDPRRPGPLPRGPGDGPVRGARLRRPRRRPAAGGTGPGAPGHPAPRRRFRRHPLGGRADRRNRPRPGVKTRERRRRTRRTPEGIRITKVGLWYVLFAVLVAIAATNTGNNALYLVVAVMLGTLVVSGVVSRHNVDGLEVDLRPGSDDLFANQPFRIDFVLRNRSRWFPHWLLLISASRKATGVGAPRLIPYLPRRGESRGRLELLIRRRGRHHIRAVHVSSLFPFGFFRKGARYHVDLELLVLPEVYRRLRGRGGRDRPAGGRGLAAGRLGARAARVAGLPPGGRSPRHPLEAHRPHGRDDLHGARIGGEPPAVDPVRQRRRSARRQRPSGSASSAW